MNPTYIMANFNSPNSFKSQNLLNQASGITNFASLLYLYVQVNAAVCDTNKPTKWAVWCHSL